MSRSKTRTLRYLGVGVCLLLAGGLAAIYVRYPVLASAIEWLFLGVGLAFAGVLWWASRKHGAAEPPAVRRLTPEATARLRRDLLAALAIGFAGVVAMVAPIVAGTSLLGMEIPAWLAVVWVGVWFGLTLVFAAPFIRRVSGVLLSPIGPGGDGGEEGREA